MTHPPDDHRRSSKGDATGNYDGDLTDADFDEVVTTEPNILGAAQLEGFLSSDAPPGSPDYVPSKDETSPPKTPEELLAGVRTGAWLEQQTFAPLRYAIEGLIPEGLTLLVGSPKIGKSWLVLDLGLARSGPRRALAAIPVTKARPVLYLALEDADRRMQERCKTLLGKRPIPQMFEYITEVEPGQIESTIAAWFTAHRRQQPLCLVDTLARAMPFAKPGEGVYQRDYRAATQLKAISDGVPGSAIVVCHHDRKAEAEDYVDTISGTNGLAGGVDTILVLTRPRNSEWGLLRRTGRDVSELDLAVNFLGGPWVLEGGTLDSAAQASGRRATTQGLGDRSTAIVDYVNAHHESTAAQIAEAIEVPTHQIFEYLRRLHGSNRILKVKRGVYAPAVCVCSVCSDNTQTHTTNRGYHVRAREGKVGKGHQWLDFDHS